MAITTLENGYVLVPRADWGARHSAGTKKMAKGRRKVFIHHTVTNWTNNPCQDMANVEKILHQRGLAPGYSYTVHPSGVVLEGAGHMVGAHTGGHNSEGFGFALIGNYDKLSPTLIQLVNIARSINALRWVGYITADISQLEIIPHRATVATACPGANMMAKINGKTMLEWIHHFVEQGV